MSHVLGNKVGDAVIPGWIVKTIVTVVLTALITGASAWGVNLSRSRAEHETRITVIEKDQLQVHKDLDEIKSLTRQQNEDTKEILRRLPRR